MFLISRSSLVLMLVVTFQNIFLSFGVIFNIFLIARHHVLGKGTTVNKPLVIEW